ncbi:hypothetical protein AGRO_2546 [Agrobacterium sp. ATCC 31749]|uniref:hypothetical protein n=1 Tax=Agrobacterium TaxID=357 RepID=UPI00020DBA74|nr:MULTISPECIES: hypothetical protein [Agrobacterium]EGL64999.1 hypothetical protein AGRO_2546 [Agrobacterium sp. ATCC 31749]NTB06989.1 hypothetical protein [Agrobacterium fabrum]CAH0159050.1 hypothetical protein SRABI05_00742 [Agrobacterium fabrum]CAH0299898.1 hypothetical protein SRABI46_04612 [Agrobacterium fabrum]
MKTARTLLLAVLLAAAGILPSLPARAAEDKVDLQGEWTTECLKIGKNDRHGIITRITIRDSRIHAVSQIYASNGCQRPTVQVRYEGTLDGGLKDQNSLLFAHTVTSITMTPNDGDVVEHYNRDPKGMGCGLSDWKENIALDVDGRTCAAITFARKGETLFDRAWIDGNKLRFAAFPVKWSNHTPDDRPQSPLETVYYRTSY